MLEYNVKNEYELIAKHCPKCQALVMAAVIKTLQGEILKYKDIRCSSCDWQSPLAQLKSS
ncbi:MAG: hypothetical protein N3F66_12950 [Spirochaetes bacterium]|nr:hypothetical protein [Spirochaetota bacterium]